MDNSSAESLPIQEVATGNMDDEQAKGTSSNVDVQVSSFPAKNPANPYTALSDSIREGVGDGPKKIRFFGPRFMTIWVMPMAVTGIIMEFLFVGPVRNVNPFN